MRRTTALVRVIGNASGEDSAYAAVAKDLAAAGRFDSAGMAIGLITGTSARAEALVALSGALAAVDDYQRSAITAEKAVQAADSDCGALITWARALMLSGEPDRAVTAAERAVRAAESAQNLDQRAEALATWSATLAASGRQAQALAAAERSTIAVDGPDVDWRSDPQYWRDRRAQNVAAIFAEGGLAEQAIMTARSLADEYDRDDALARVAEKLAQRGLADRAIDAVRARSHFASFRGSDDLGKIARVLSRHGHGDGALRAAYALAEIDEAGRPPGHAEFDIASMVADVVRILAESGHIEAALQTARKSRPSRQKATACAAVACAVALAGDTERAVEIAETQAGPAGVARVASALAESGRAEEALPIAEHAIRAVLTGPPGRQPPPMPSHCSRSWSRCPRAESEMTSRAAPLPARPPAPR